MLKSRRIYSTLNMQTCSMQWYVEAREGRLGPYESQTQAINKLKSFVSYCVDKGHSGGREPVVCQHDDLTHLSILAQRRL